MGLIHVTVSLRVPGAADGSYEELFLVDTGATDSMAPASELRRAGIKPIGKVHDHDFGLAQIEVMGEVTAGRIIFGPDDAEPILGSTALASVGITPTLERLPAIPLK